MFRFKRFTIHQDRCAMKLTEIACIQGAWTKLPSSAKQVLDIGFGTGILSLCLAQRYPAITIDAVEIDSDSFHQGSENIQASPYHNRIIPYLSDIKTFEPHYAYDFIIVNPPFFEHQLPSPHSQKNTAWHSAELSLAELIHHCIRLGKEDVQISILLPSSRKEDLFNLIASSDLTLLRCLDIRHEEDKPVRFFVAIIGKLRMETEYGVIRLKKHGQRSKDVQELLGDFYL